MKKPVISPTLSVILILTLVTEYSHCLQCYFNTNSTHITELPTRVTCQCNDTAANASFDTSKDIFDKFSEDLTEHVQLVVVQHCKTLRANLNDSDFDIEIANTQDLFINVDVASNTNLQNIAIKNVSQVGNRAL